MDQTKDRDMREQIRNLEKIFEAGFFAVIKRECGFSVAKYWLTGVLPVFLDGINSSIISSDKPFHSLCGFTQGELDAIVGRALRHISKDHQDQVIALLKTWCDGYQFYPTCDYPSDHTPLYHPQLVFAHLQRINSGATTMPCLDKANEIHLASALEAVSEHGNVSIHDIINLCTSERVKRRYFPVLYYPELFQEGRSAESAWALLYYLGIVTRQHGDDSLRIPNRTMQNLVSY
jgi:Predicted AAA-ATPase